MKKIEIRFVARCKSSDDVPDDYLIQQKKWYGWKYIGQEMSGGYFSYFQFLLHKDKEKLLEYFIENHLKTNKKQVEIIEHPMLKMY